MIFRKITERLERFYRDNGKYALLIDGARQVGKTFIIEAFGRSHYETVVKIGRRLYMKLASRCVCSVSFAQHHFPEQLEATCRPLDLA